MRYFAVIIGIMITLLVSIDTFARHGGRGCGRGGLYHGGIPAAFGESPYFAPPENCAACHNTLWDAWGNDVSIYDDWAATMMSQAARDPLWQAKVASEVLRNPEIGSQLQERCARCHTPMAHTEAQFDDQRPQLLDDGFLNPRNPLFEKAEDGVSCTLCHQILGTKLGTDQSFTGKYVIDPITPRPDRAIFGPYWQTFQMPMRRHSGFTPYYGDQVPKSELCAACHTLFVPVTDSQGKIIGESPEQTPYIEWQHSIYGDNNGSDDLSCQQCHMPEADGPVVISSMPHHLGPRSPFRKHHFVGGNAFVLKMIRDDWQDHAGTGQRRRFDVTIARALRQLQDNTSDIRIHGIQETDEGLEFRVEVTNQTGHKFPTGIPARRAWLHLLVSDANGSTIFESGRPGPDGTIEGNAADVAPTAFEPHYEVISHSDQVQIYESILATSDGELTYALSRGIEHLKENRLLPKGFDKATAPGAILPHGAALMDDNFGGGSDTTVYRIETNGAALPLTIDAELLYQEAGFAFIRDLLQFKAQSPQIARFAELYQRAEKTPVRIGWTRVNHAPR